MILKCHICKTEFDEKYAIYFETPGNPQCPLCRGSIAGIRNDPQNLPKAKRENLNKIMAEIRSKSLFSDSSTIEIDDAVLEEILINYFVK